MKHISVNKPERCPNCGSTKIADILYGLPRRVETKKVNIGEKFEIKFVPELEEKIQAGKVVLGGCIISDRSPTWWCKDCKTGIFKPQKVRDSDRL